MIKYQILVVGQNQEIVVAFLSTLIRIEFYFNFKYCKVENRADNILTKVLKLLKFIRAIFQQTVNN